MKLILGMMFSLVLCVTVNAQTYPVNPANPVNPAYPVNPANEPAPDDIICLETSSNVFECSVNDPSFGQGEMMEDFQIIDEYNEVDLYNDQVNRQNYYMENPNGDMIIEDDQTVDDKMLEQKPAPGTDFNENEYIENKNDNLNRNEYQEYDEDKSQNDREIIIEESSGETTAFRR